MFNFKKFSPLLLGFSLVVTSCEKEPESPKLPLPEDVRAIVLNEGQYGKGTSSLSVLYYNGDVEQGLFEKTNNRKMGDVAQSMIKIEDRYYVTLSNSNKLEVFDSKSFQSIETMPLAKGDLPMYMEHLGGDSIAVTETDQMTSTSKLVIMDINHGKKRDVVRRTVALKGNSFQMELVNNKLFVGGDELAVFDLKNLTVEGKRPIKNDNGDAISLVSGSKVLTDGQNNLWVMGYTHIYCINTSTEKVVKTLDISALKTDWVSCFDISPDKKTIYINAARKVYALDLENLSVPTLPIIDKSTEDPTWTVYQMSVSKENTIFLSEVLFGANSSGKVYEYDPSNGKNIRMFAAGIFPRFTHFE